MNGEVSNVFPLTCEILPEKKKRSFVSFFPSILNLFHNRRLSVHILWWNGLNTTQHNKIKGAQFLYWLNIVRRAQRVDLFVNSSDSLFPHYRTVIFKWLYKGYFDSLFSSMWIQYNNFSVIFLFLFSVLLVLFRFLFASLVIVLCFFLYFFISFIIIFSIFSATITPIFISIFILILKSWIIVFIHTMSNVCFFFFYFSVFRLEHHLCVIFYSMCYTVTFV